jgi:hypothetical protein
MTCGRQHGKRLPEEVKMTTEIHAIDRSISKRTLEVSSMQEVAETLRDDSLAHARLKSRGSRGQGDVATLLGQREFLEQFRYELACGVAAVLAANDKNVRAAYTYEPGNNPDSETGEASPPEASVHLLLLVSSPSAGLEAFLATLDRGLTASLRALPVARWQSHESVLDVNLVTEEEAAVGRGFGALLSSVFSPPLKVWPRQS